MVPTTIILLFKKSLAEDLSLSNSGTLQILRFLNFEIELEVNPIFTVDAIQITPLKLSFLITFLEQTLLF